MKSILTITGFYIGSNDCNYYPQQADRNWLPVDLPCSCFVSHLENTLNNQLGDGIGSPYWLLFSGDGYGCGRMYRTPRLLI